jgi:NADH-quinone oxidoreductase subunit I
VDYGRCVFCGLCVDACPFDALYMTNDYELAAYDKAGLKYTPDMLGVPPKLEGRKYKVEFDTKRGPTTHG